MPKEGVFKWYHKGLQNILWFNCVCLENGHLFDVCVCACMNECSMCICHI